MWRVLSAWKLETRKAQSRRDDCATTTTIHRLRGRQSPTTTEADCSLKNSDIVLRFLRNQPCEARRPSAISPAFSGYPGLLGKAGQVVCPWGIRVGLRTNEGPAAFPLWPWRCRGLEVNLAVTIGWGWRFSGWEVQVRVLAAALGPAGLPIFRLGVKSCISWCACWRLNFRQFPLPAPTWRGYGLPAWAWAGIGIFLWFFRPAYSVFPPRTRPVQASGFVP